MNRTLLEKLLVVLVDIHEDRTNTIKNCSGEAMEEMEMSIYQKTGRKIGICLLVEMQAASQGRLFTINEDPLYLDVWMDSVFKKWPKYSGLLGFPVPHPRDDVSPYNAFNGSRSLWVGEYGKNRMELLEFLISQAKKELEEYRVFQKKEQRC